MKFKFKYVPISLFVAINIAVIIAMNFCAYTCYLHATYHPNFSFFGLAFPAFLVLDICFILFWLIFKWKIALLPVLGMLCCAHSVRTYCPINLKREVPEGAIKVMSYNVCYFGGALKNDEMTENNPILNYIIGSNADIVCIQEGSVANKPKVKEMLGSVYPHIQEGEESNHINVCLSKYPIIDTELIAYESKSNKSFAYKILIGNDTVLVVNNHLESYRLHDEEKDEYKSIIRHPSDKGNVRKYDSLTGILSATNKIRGLQADRVAEYVDSVPCRYKIVCGDFNDPSLSYTHHRLTRSLVDAYTQSGFGPGISFHESGMYFRIDGILVSDNITTYQTKVDNSIVESDHYPIISHLFLKEK